MTDNNDTLLREVDEELRREQWAKLWDRYGAYVLAGAVAIVAVVGGYKVWEARQLAFSQASGSQYSEAIRLAASGKADEATKALDALSASGHSGYSALAQLQRAGVELKSGKPKEALVIFEKLSGTPGVDPMLKGFAQLQAASILLGEADFTQIQNRLTDLTADGSPWRHSARELLGLAALKAGKPEDASKTFEALLADRTTPRGIAERARVVMSSIASAALGKAAEAPASSPAPESPPAK